MLINLFSIFRLVFVKPYHFPKLIIDNHILCLYFNASLLLLFAIINTTNLALSRDPALMSQSWSSFCLARPLLLFLCSL